MPDNTIDISGDITSGFSKKFIAELSKIDPSQPVTVTINSEGGSLQEAFAVYDYLKNGAGKDLDVYGYIYGMCASAATVVTCAFKDVKMGEYAMYMTHEPYYTDGTEDEADANILENRKNKLIDVYVNKTGKDRDQIARLVSGETYYDAQGALEVGFIDAIAYEKEIAARLPKDKLEILNKRREAALTGDVSQLTELEQKQYAPDTQIKSFLKQFEMNVIDKIKSMVQPTKDIKNNVVVTLNDGKEYYVETSDAERTEIMAGDVMFHNDTKERVSAGNYEYEDKIIRVGEDGVIEAIEEREVEAKIELSDLANAIIEISDRMEALENSIKEKTVQKVEAKKPALKITAKAPADTTEPNGFDVVSGKLKGMLAAKRGIQFN